VALLTAGTVLDRLHVRLVRGSWQQFGVDWESSPGVPADLSGYAAVVELDDAAAPVSWAGTVVAVPGRTTWTVTPAMAAVLADRATFHGRMILTQAQVLVMYAVVIEMQP
jgi:hypothetical protein